MRTFAKTFTGLLVLFTVLASSVAWADRDRGDRGRGWGHRNHDHGRSHVSVNVNVGRPYYRDYRDYRYRPSIRSGSYSAWNYGVGVGFYSGWGSPYARWDYFDRSYYNSRPVIVEKNIYIERATPTNRVTTRAVTSSTVSLFRDRYGRCYEREIDGFGNESRIELDPSECNF